MEIHAHAKVNIFLKITGHEGGYHTLISRFVKVQNLYDTLTFEPCVCDEFTIEGGEGVGTTNNTIFKSYTALMEATRSEKMERFFASHKVVVTKRIPTQAGLGGGSSDAAAFMRLANSLCHLALETEVLAKIGEKIGADIPFFIYDYESANVSGFGERVERFNEPPLQIECFTPPIGCDTAIVYKTFREHFLSSIVEAPYEWLQTPSRQLLSQSIPPTQINDLYPAALLAYPKLAEYADAGWYFSGSGSSFFRVV